MDDNPIRGWRAAVGRAAYRLFDLLARAVARELVRRRDGGTPSANGCRQDQPDRGHHDPDRR